MLRQLRRKFASSISIIQGEDDFLYNTWLRVPLHSSVQLGQLASTLLETPYITFEIDPPFLSKHFFTLGETTVWSEDLKYLFKKVGTNPVFFQLLYVPSKVTYHPDIEPRPAGYSAKRVEFLLSKPLDWDVSVQFKQPGPQGFLFKFSSPEIKDYLHNLKPRIMKVELLNQDELNYTNENTEIHGGGVTSFGEVKFKTISIDSIKKPPRLFKVKVPGMGTYKSRVSGVSLKQLFIPDVSKKDILQITQPVISATKFDLSNLLMLKENNSQLTDMVYDPGLMENVLSDKGNAGGVIKLLLKNSFKVEWAKRKDYKIQLTKFENDGAKFLAENDRAFLAEEPGLEKVKETLAALKFLFLSKVIRSALLVVPLGYIGNTKKAEELCTDLGWLGSLKKYCSDLPYSIINGDDDERSDSWNKSALIYIVDHESFVRDYNLNILDKKRLTKFDCIVFDEIRILMEKPVKTISFFEEINPDVLWVLSSILKDDLLTALNQSLNEGCRIESVKMRQLKNIPEKEFTVKHKEYWLEPDEYQKIEYKEILVNCKKELKRVLESGNPFRYQSNIFILLHKIFQVENFAHGYDTSPKTDLLLQHLQAIKNNKQKVIITSQYDRQGTKKLERLLDQHKISYVTAPSSLSADEVKKAITLFKSKNTVTAFLTNAKLSRLSFGDFYIPYIIRFDSWWNPALIGQTKDLFDVKEGVNDKKTLVVFSYKMLNTIDERIKKVLLAKEFIDEDIINVMPTNAINDLISIEEWLKVFEMPVEDNQQKNKKLFDDTVETLNNFSLADYRATLSRFFHSLGYTNIDILEHENSASFDIIGRGKSGKQDVELYCNVLLNDLVSKKTIKQIIVDSSLIQNRNTFIITRGNFEKGCDEITTQNVKLLDNEKLALYIVTLNINQTQHVYSA